MDLTVAQAMIYHKKCALLHEKSATADVVRLHRNHSYDRNKRPSTNSAG